MASASVNRKFTRKEIETLLYLRYGKEIQLNDKKTSEFDLHRTYVFKRVNPIQTRHDDKEFTMALQELLFRNYHLIDSIYKKDAIYSYILNSTDYVKNTKKSFLIKLKLNNEEVKYKFVPDWIHKDGKTFLHYFDGSYYQTSHQLICSIERYFNNDKEFILNMYEYQRDLYKDFD